MNTIQFNRQITILFITSMQYILHYTTHSTDNDGYDEVHEGE